MASIVPRLRMEDFAGPNNWRWVLSDQKGMFIADYQVQLNSSEPEYAALWNLHLYLNRHAIPDQRRASEVRLIERVGEWISQRLLGATAPNLLKLAPTSIRVVLPAAASLLFSIPLEITRVNGKSLVEQGVSFVYELDGEEAETNKQPIGTKLRMLAVFSLPTDASALALRRERYELKRQIARIALTQNLGIEFRILQYGVTRDTLRQVLEEGNGWDIVHFSGHGERASLQLEKSDGTYDPMSASEFVNLLEITRGQVKLVMLSSCLSAATTVVETMRWLGLDTSVRTDEKPIDDKAAVGSLARELVRRAACSVVAMRYPVADEFAISFGRELYERLIGRNQLLTRAYQLGLLATLSSGYQADIPPISLATPGLFGARCVSLFLKAPAVELEKMLPDTGFAFVPPEPAHFVGRAGPMSRASASMAPQSNQNIIVFHGMAGAGKTACAIELTRRYETGRFQHFAWFKAPDEGAEIASEVRRFALTLETSVPGLNIVEWLEQPGDTNSEISWLRAALEKRSILIVLDNLESLLTADGGWRDSHWKRIVSAMLNHDGYSRLIITSRRKPRDLEGNQRVLMESIDALSLSEAILLAHELPNLGRLLRGSEASDSDHRKLVQQTLYVVQGHPKLIDFAEAQARDPQELARSVERAKSAWISGADALRAFFKTGESRLQESEFLQAIDQWSGALLESLIPSARSFFHFLCCLEEEDREESVVTETWPVFAKASQASDDQGTLELLQGTLEAAALLKRETISQELTRYSIHPAVAGAIRSRTDKEFAARVDRVMGEHWILAFKSATSHELEGYGRLVIRAGLRGAPYLMRTGRWRAAAQALEAVGIRDGSPLTLEALVALDRKIVSQVRGTEDEPAILGSFAVILTAAGRESEGKEMVLKALRESEERTDYRSAAALAGFLAETLLDKGEFEAAVGYRVKELCYIDHVPLGPWSRLMAESRELKEILLRGAYEKVIAIWDGGLASHLESLPDVGPEQEAAKPWQVRERFYDLVQTALMETERWVPALEMNARLLRAAVARGASESEVTRITFNDHYPLLRLDRINEARELLHRCRERSENQRDISQLAKTLAGLSTLEYMSKNLEQSLVFETASIRYKYLGGDAESCAIGHSNLANRLMAMQRFDESVAHRLASALIAYQMMSPKVIDRINKLAITLASSGSELPLRIRSFGNLCRVIDATEGVRFRELFDRLPKRAATGQEALDKTLDLLWQSLGSG